MSDGEMRDALNQVPCPCNIFPDYFCDHCDERRKMERILREQLTGAWFREAQK